MSENTGATPAGVKGFSNEQPPNVSEDQSQKEIIAQYKHHIEKLKEEFERRLDVDRAESNDKDAKIADL